MSQIVEDPIKFGLHSMRPGGAISAAENGVSDREISKHGKRSSNSCRGGYIRPSDNNKFRITKNLGI